MAKISDLLRSGPTLSFEFSAPRTPKAAEGLEQTLARIASLRPSFMSVTYGAGGSSRGPTYEVVAHIDRRLGVTAMPHFTCVAHTREEIEAIIAGYYGDGIENLLALRGDVPQDGPDEPTGHFKRAVDLVAFARERARFDIGVAAHPEGHPMATSRGADLEHHAAKLREADFAITQFFFRTEYYARFVDEMARRGVLVPVIPGVMPPNNLAGVARMSALNATEFPVEIQRQLEAAGDDAEARQEIAVEFATKLCEELRAVGAPGIHLYTMNLSAAALRIVENLGWQTPAESDG
jgi:methylenetetrahydrofolate reductase (NADPH)